MTVWVRVPAVATPKARRSRRSGAMCGASALARAPRLRSLLTRSGDEKADMGHLPILVALVEEADEEVREDDGEQHEEGDHGDLHLGHAAERLQGVPKDAHPLEALRERMGDR